jgi:peptidoglycan/LPS O-acetylase OafA/YrhL
MTAAGARPVGGHVAALDGIRGLAILAVFVHNVGYFDEPTDSLALKSMRLVIGGGWVGVQLFFVLSGLLITGILLDTRRDPHRLRSFYVRRVLRIFPLYYLTLACAFVLLPRVLDLGEWGERARHVQVWYWTYLMNWSDPYKGTLPGLSHFWSLAVEEQFYLVWPLVVFGLSVRDLTRVCAALIVSALFIRVGFVLGGAPPAAIYGFTITRWDSLAWGAVLAVALREVEWRERVLPWIRRATLPAGVTLAVVVVVDHGLSWAKPLGQTAGYSLVASLFAGLVLLAADPSQPGGWVRRVTESGWLRFFGKYSYGMYVLHWPIHRVGQTVLSHWVIVGTAASRPLHLVAYVAGTLAVTTIAAVAVYHVIELPFLSLKDRLAPRVPSLR